MEQPQELRELASWYRSWGDVGTAGDRAWREGFADYLEKLAVEMECAPTRDVTAGEAIEGRPHRVGTGINSKCGTTAGSASAWPQPA